MTVTTASTDKNVVTSSYGQQTPTILCIDDDPQITSSIELRLSNYDVKVICNFTGMQGIWQAIQHRPDLIISDLRMPQGDGEYLLECIRNNKATAHTPVILLSGVNEHALESRMRCLGADSFLRKPVHYQQLLSEIGKYVELREKS